VPTHPAHKLRPVGERHAAAAQAARRQADQLLRGGRRVRAHAQLAERRAQLRLADQPVAVRVQVPARAARLAAGRAGGRLRRRGARMPARPTATAA